VRHDEIADGGSGLDPQHELPQQLRRAEIEVVGQSGRGPAPQGRSTLPLTATIVVVGTPLGPPLIGVLVVSKKKVSPVRTTQSKLPFGPPVPSNWKADSVSCRDAAPSPPKSKPSRTSSLPSSAGSRLVKWTVRVGTKAKSSIRCVPGSPTRSSKPTSTMARTCAAWSRMESGSRRAFAPVSSQLATRVARVSIVRRDVPVGRALEVHALVGIPAELEVGGVRLEGTLFAYHRHGCPRLEVEEGGAEVGREELANLRDLHDSPALRVHRIGGTAVAPGTRSV
jgi:hypothetical protein